MTIENVLHMKGGLGDTSYAMNSQLQNTAISKGKPFVENTITDFYSKTSPKCLKIADLGCSCGPNALTVVKEVIDAIDTLCKTSDRTLPEFQITLNDLYGNDFNTLFRYIPNFIENLKEGKSTQEFEPPYLFISGMPGSFYGRLFPSNTLHFVHSSYCLHFLAQVPPNIGNTTGKVYIGNNTPAPVVRAYLTQFQKDLTLFLDSRSQEVVPGGRMVLTLVGRQSSDPTAKECCQLYELFARTFREMVSEGLVEEAKLDSFNLPLYHPNTNELLTVVQEQGSFGVDSCESFIINWDTCNDPPNKKIGLISGQKLSSTVRAALEPIIVNHFGEEIMDQLFGKYARHIGEYLAVDEGYFVNHIICLRKN